MRLSYRPAAAAAALALVLAAPVAVDAAGCAVTHSREWSSIRLPEIPRSPLGALPGTEGVVRGAAATMLAVNQRNPAQLLISNGATVMRSTDGGCTWQAVFDITAPAPDRPFLESHSLIHEILWDPSAANHKYVYLLVGMPENVLPWVTGSYQTQVYRSADAGATWAPAGPLLPGRAPDLAIAPGNTSRLYLSMTVGPVFAVERVVYATDDRGASWLPRTVPPLPATQEYDRLSMTVDPVNPDEVWATDFTRIRRSTDGAVTWAEVPYDEHPDSGGLDVYRTSAAKPARLLVRAPQNSTATPPWHQAGGKPLVYRSDDGGRIWRPIIAPKGIGAARHGAGSRYVMYGGSDGDAPLWRFDTRSNRFAPVRPPAILAPGVGTIDYTRKPAMWSLGAIVDAKTKAPRYQVLAVYRGTL